MEFFFNPRGIALIGATPNPQKGGNAILKNLIIGFKGGIYPVNPRYKEIEGIVCYKSIAEVEDPVDLAIVFIPGKMILQIIKDCAQRGLKGVIIESSGFAESGEEGRQMQQELKTFAQNAGIRLWGPNCMGLVDAVNRKIFSFVSPALWDTLLPGEVSLIVQSGMLSGAFLIDCMSHGTMGISKVCSIGNKMDVNECEILEYLLTDPDTRVIGLYLESINHGRRFMEICQHSTKPIVLLKGGKSVIGAKAAMGHTASMAGNGAVISGAMAQVGVIEAMDFKQMMDICKSLAAYPRIKTRGKGRVAIITYTGGAGIVSSDFMEQFHLEPAILSDAARDTLKTVFPEWMPPSNPIDLWPAVERHGAAKAYGTAIEAACEDPGIDAIFIHAFAGGFALTLDLKALSIKAREAGKPVFCWLIGKQDEARAFLIETQECGIPVYRELYRAVECMDAVFTHGTRLPAQDSAQDSAQDLTQPAQDPSGNSADSLISCGTVGTTLQSGALSAALQSAALQSGDLAGTLQPCALPDDLAAVLQSATGVLDEHLSKTVLAACGIPVTLEKIVDTVEDACREASGNLKYPVVMKGLVPGSVHKTEGGLVKLNIQFESQVRTAFKALTHTMKGKGKILIQQQIEGDLELIAGLVRDPQFGPCVMMGFGGVMAEILDDVVFGVAPLSHTEALALIGRLKHQKLLDGFRGSTVVERDALAKILSALGELAIQYPVIKEIDVNPLIMEKGLPIAVDASIIV